MGDPRRLEVSDEGWDAARARAGDGAAFERLVRRHDDHLRGLAFHLLGDRALMDDVMQEVYLKAFRALPRFDGRSTLGTWLHRLTYNACIDELRRSRRRPAAHPLEDSEGIGSTAPGPGELAVRRSEVRAALASLSPEERTAVWLVDVVGSDYAAAAAVLGCPEGTIASRLSRARAALRVALGAPAGSGAA